MAVCDHCRFRHSWDCEDGFAMPKKGCDSFELDFDTLTKRQQKAIRKILSHEDEEDCYDEDEW